jgi:2,3-bisphosphoglycerate-dependent phosphoglycerate mutase
LRKRRERRRPTRASRHGTTLVIDDRLAERRLSPSPRADWLDLIRKSFDDLDFAVPDGESLREAQTRGLAALTDIAAKAHRLPAVATHGNLLSSVLRHADPSFGFASWQDLRNPDLFLIRMRGGPSLSFERLDP